MINKEPAIPWEINRRDFPWKDSLDNQARFILGYGILAPSTHNSQPWMFKIEKKSVKIFGDPLSYSIKEGDPLKRNFYISMGALIENIFIAGTYFGIIDRIEYCLNDVSDLIAEVFLKTPSLNILSDSTLIDSITKRRNVRGFFESDKIPDQLINKLTSIKPPDDTTLALTTDKTSIEEYAKLTAEGLQIAYRNSLFRKEMSRWIFSNNSKKKYGLIGYTLRMPLLISIILPTLIRYVDIGKALGKKNYESIASASLVGVYGSSKNDPATWIAIGRHFEHIALLLVSQGLYSSIFVAAIEMHDLWQKIQKLTGRLNRPQFLFCSGIMNNLPRHSPRYFLEEKLL